MLGTQFVANFAMSEFSSFRRDYRLPYCLLMCFTGTIAGCKYVRRFVCLPILFAGIGQHACSLFPRIITPEGELKGKMPPFVKFPLIN